jgi:hypothetical protein
VSAPARNVPEDFFTIVTVMKSLGALGNDVSMVELAMELDIET